jgi:capsular polysaccharide transport system permease protein
LLNPFKSVKPLFAAVVILPTLLAAVYYGLLAEDVYVSESRIIVRTPEKSEVSALGAVLGSTSLGGATEEGEAVREFLQSRDALAQINADGFVTRSYGAPSLFIVDRFGGLGGDTGEQLYEYFSDRVTLEDGEGLQVLRLQVEAFDPAEAQAINQRLLEGSEALVNALSERAQDDAVRFAVEEAAEARESARSASLALARFRDREGIVDPELQATVGLQMIAQLQGELIEARTRLRQMRTNTPQASQIPYLRAQVDELEEEIERQTASIAGGRGSLSAGAARYQELQVASQFADQQLAIALATLQDAQADARRKQAYVDRISEPSLPDYPAAPRRLRAILATLVLGFLAWGVLSMLLVGIKEHRD